MQHADVKRLLDTQVARFNIPSFIPDDPISIPHRFSQKQDIEIAAFWTAMLSWGQRKTILKNADFLLSLMDFAPYDFILNHRESDRKKFLSFVHRTFQPLDALYFLEFFQWFYQRESSLEQAFLPFISHPREDVGAALAGFHSLFFSLPTAPSRTTKHVATPVRGSTCKRLNMFLRWMVRKDAHGVDFGIWNGITPAQLLIPLDVHVDRVARRLGLIQRNQTDWHTVLELTAALRAFDPQDPVKYDYALFGMGVVGTKEW